MVVYSFKMVRFFTVNLDKISKNRRICIVGPLCGLKAVFEKERDRMRKLVFSTLAASIIIALNGCQSLDGLLDNDTKATQSKPSEVGVTQQKITKPQKYEQAPDLSQGEQLSFEQGGLSSDTGLINMSTSPEQVRQGVALSDQLQAAPTSNNTQTGAANPYASISEGDVSGDEGEVLVFDQNAAATMQGNVNSNLNGTYKPNYGYNNSPQAATTAQDFQSGNDGRCSLNLNQEASGLSRVLIKELAERLRTEPGDVFVAPTTISPDYTGCIRDLSSAIKDGLAGSQVFNVVPGTTNLNNVISQNIGSNTILPNLIHYSRAASIPYLITSNIRKTGGKAALTLRIIRTEDGITLSQTFRRLSE